MNLTRSVFARRVAIAALAGLAAAFSQAGAAQDHPLAGTWNFVPEKSRITGGEMPYKSLTLTIPESGEPVMNVEGVDADGDSVKATFNSIVDGKQHPITGISDFDRGTWTRNSDTNTSYSYSKGRTVVILGTRVLSADGKTLTFREQAYDRNGRPTSTSILIFDNPNVQVASVAPASGGGGAATTTSALTTEEQAAATLLAKGDDDAAIAMFTKIIEGKPTPMLYYDHVSRGIAYAKKSQFEQALADFDAAVKLKPDDVDALFRRGSTRAQLKQYQGAIEDMTAVIKADPMHGQAYKLRGFSYNVLGDDKSAGADYDKACALDKSLCI